MDIDKLIEDVERLDREATPGPWLHYKRADTKPSEWPAWALADVEDEEEQRIAAEGEPADIALTVHYRTAAPVLAAEVKRLRAGGCARDQRTTQFCAEAVAKDAEIAKLRDQILGYQQSLHIAEQEIARLKRALVEPTEQTGDPDSEHGAPVCVLCGRDIDVSAPFSTGPASGPAGRILGDDESAHGECLDHARQGVA